MDANVPSKANFQATRRRLVVLRLMAVVMAVCVSLLLAEAGLRLVGYSPAYLNAMGSFHEADQITGHRGKRDFSARFKTPQFDTLVVHNERGFRQQEHENPESSTAHRLFVFGDSFVWGWGVSQGAVFTDQLSGKLPDWHVENLGINGTGTVAQYELFSAECRDSLTPGDVVLLTFFGNDFTDNVEGARRATIQDGKVVTLPADSPLRGGWQRTLQESSYLFNCLSYVVNRWQLDRRLRRAHEQAVVLAAAAEVEYAKKAEAQHALAAAIPQVAASTTAVLGDNTAASAPPIASTQSEADVAPAAADSAVSPDNSPPQIVVTRHFLEKWKQDCDRHQVRFLVAYVPGVAELGEGGNAAMAMEERAFRQTFFSCTDSLGIDVIDLLPEMLAAKKSGRIDQLLIPADGHWNAVGHGIVADIVAARLPGASMARR
jgi:lysophospholipase L1-like esterase